MKELLPHWLNANLLNMYWQNTSQFLSQMALRIETAKRRKAGSVQRKLILSVKEMASTELKTEMNVEPEWEEMLGDGWPKALAKLKEICER